MVINTIHLYTVFITQEVSSSTTDIILFYWSRLKPFGLGKNCKQY